MGILSKDESVVWQEFQKGKNTSTIAEERIKTEVAQAIKEWALEYLQTEA